MTYGVRSSLHPTHIAFCHVRFKLDSHHHATRQLCDRQFCISLRLSQASLGTPREEPSRRGRHRHGVHARLHHPIPLPPKKGERIYFGAIKIGKAYVSFHLFPLYMNPELVRSISPVLKKRMQGKTCFNFRSVPDRMLLKELDHLVAAGFKDFRQKRWV